MPDPLTLYQLFDLEALHKTLKTTSIQTRIDQKAEVQKCQK